MSDTYTDNCNICGVETDVIQGVCEDCAIDKEITRILCEEYVLTVTGGYDGTDDSGKEHIGWVVTKEDTELMIFNTDRTTAILEAINLIEQEQEQVG